MKKTYKLVKKLFEINNKITLEEVIDLFKKEFAEIVRFE